MSKWIIQREANETGTRGNQTWNGATPPDGYVWCSEEDIMNVYAPFMGFVELEIDGDTCTKMTGNQELLDKWKEEHPEPDPSEEQISDEEAVAIIKGEITDAEALKIISGGTENDEE